MIKLDLMATYYGPNPYSLEPVIVAQIQFVDVDTSILQQMCDSVVRYFPDWCESSATLEADVELAFARLASQWALSALTEVRGFLHQANAVRTSNGLRMYLGFHEAELSFRAMQLALRMMLKCHEPGFSLAAVRTALDGLWNLCRKKHPDYQATILMDAARQLKVPVLPYIRAVGYWQFGWGSRSRIFYESLSDQDSVLGTKIAANKQLCKNFFDNIGAPSPPFTMVKTVEDLPLAVQHVGWPCVVKPIHLGKGAGVTAGINNLEQLEAAFLNARTFSEHDILMESHIQGQDYRLTTVNGKLCSVVRRAAAQVRGDGVKSIRELVAELNQQRSGNLHRSGYLRVIEIDEVMQTHLAAQGLCLETILELGQVAVLRSNANVSTGGFLIEVLDEVHPDIRMMAEMISQALGLSIAGLDYISPDISQSWTVNRGAFIEVNSTPGLDVFLASGLFIQRVARELLGLETGRIATRLMVIAAKDLDRLERAIVSFPKPDHIAWVCGAQAGLGSLSIQCRSDQVWASIYMLLKIKQARSIVIAVSAEQFMQFGAPLEFFDSSIVQNLTLSSNWLTVLQKISGSISIVDSVPEEIFSLMLNESARANSDV
ncbi:hypothetical protein [Undibacterium fentianense]|uniref:ATP-grasp domain-containing protein n=1 Tax=Undibacterium fentianense TaxID=2828728 RepID=A0A941IBZ3_9BURK|nr:hypothetical protein [Undibacterium fentianense]MBR7799624.1 hypothetical protein [Undibacterium fentianense]